MFDVSNSNSGWHSNLQNYSMKNLLLLVFISLFGLQACSQKQTSTTTTNASAATESKPQPGSDVQRIADYLGDKDYSAYGVATFAGGCFWCTEAAFEQIKGVVDVISGYTGGHTDYPTYELSNTGRTGHTEAIQIYYDKDLISFEKLLEILFVAHDPTQLNRQGPDRGPQYRSGIYYHSEEQKLAIETMINYLNESGVFGKPIVTEVAAYKEFWTAEAYHQDYYPQHPENPYVQRVSRPKVEKVAKVFKDILKE